MMTARVLPLPRAPRANPGYLRSRAQFYRDLADEETDREKATLYQEIADAFDRDADARERDASS